MQCEAPKKNYYTVDEVQIILGVKPTKAYEVIRNMRMELVKKGYAEYPTGRVPIAYFNERYLVK